MAKLSLEGVSKAFGDTTVVRDVDLSIADGEFVAFLGPSGCGKSTTLRMIAGLDPVSQGRIFIGDKDATTLEPGQRDVAMVFQSYALYPHMTVRQNLEYGLKRKKVDKAIRDDRISETAAILQLDGLLERKPSQLSGGQRQRVALGRALVRHPSVLLMDEPLSNLDAKLRVHMRSEIMRLHASLGMTVIYVTHDQNEAMTMGQRIVVMNHGVVQQIGTPQELYSKPQSLFVATFLGAPEMNTFGARYDRSAGSLAMTTSSNHVKVSDPWEGAPDHGDRQVVVGIRPEHLLAVPGGGEEPGGAVDSRLQVLADSTILFTENIGSQTFAYVALGETTVSALVDRASSISRGDAVRLLFDPRHLHLFDADDGQRLNAHASPTVTA